jgi:hypothetical protein
MIYDYTTRNQQVRFSRIRSNEWTLDIRIARIRKQSTSSNQSIARPLSNGSVMIYENATRNLDVLVWRIRSDE